MKNFSDLLKKIEENEPESVNGYVAVKFSDATEIQVGYVDEVAGVCDVGLNNVGPDEYEEKVREIAPIPFLTGDLKGEKFGFYKFKDDEAICLAELNVADVLSVTTVEIDE